MTGSDYAPSGIWYCRGHAGTVNEDDGHDNDEDSCPWAYLDPEVGCDWTELVYERPAT